MNCSFEISKHNSYRVGSYWMWSFVVLASIWSFWRLELQLPTDFDFPRFLHFFSYAFRPAVNYQASFIAQGSTPLLLQLLNACLVTICFAAAGVSMALVIGLPLAFISSTRFWFGSQRVSGSRKILWLALYSSIRALTSLFRSVHELLWAVLFLAAFGLSEVTVVLAIALPYAGVFARVFADIIDETSMEAAEALEQVGAGRLSSFVLGIFPLALPNMAAYTLYRFECALRSSAVLGFFGIPTLGYYISTSFENLHYAEVWTYMYGLFFLVFILDYCSQFLRRGLVS